MVQYRQAKECRSGRVTFQERHIRVCVVEKEVSVIHENEDERFIVDIGWERRGDCIELQVTSEWSVVGASCWTRMRMGGGMNNLMGSCSPGVLLTGWMAGKSE